MVLLWPLRDLLMMAEGISPGTWTRASPIHLLLIFSRCERKERLNGATTVWEPAVHAAPVTGPQRWHVCSPRTVQKNANHSNVYIISSPKLKPQLHQLRGFFPCDSTIGFLIPQRPTRDMELKKYFQAVLLIIALHEASPECRNQKLLYVFIYFSYFFFLNFCVFLNINPFYTDSTFFYFLLLLCSIIIPARVHCLRFFFDSKHLFWFDRL